MLQASSSPLLCARSASRSTTSSTVRRRSKSTFSSSSLPASILEKSRMSLMMPSRFLPERCTVSAYLRCVLGQPGFQQQLGHAQHAVHRRADLVAHAGEERALRVVGRFGRFARQAQRFLAALALRDVARHGDLPMHWLVVVEQRRDGDLDVDARCASGSAPWRRRRTSRPATSRWHARFFLFRRRLAHVQRAGPCASAGG